MHEFSFCQGIINALETEWQRNNLKNARLLETRVVIGKLHQIIEENMQMAYSVLTKDTFAQGSKLTLIFVDIAYECNACGHTGVIQPPLFACGACCSGEVRITGGKELYLEKLEVEQFDQPADDAG